MMTSISIVKEKELGTMEVLLVSPFKPVFVIIAKAIPYLILSIVNIIFIIIRFNPCACTPPSTTPSEMSCRFGGLPFRPAS